eukprot:TRINITY_DN102828_c0_g1_i1.p1 TRINITY_DN102828_c0_g1~~TRINITY_DN102828_c0_g1_i1.p1  ORF type:complete len:341 (+),score=61.12 TRINITY_DN102828_c0_g1_i1:26-1024(+)
MGDSRIQVSACLVTTGAELVSAWFDPADRVHDLRRCVARAARRAGFSHFRVRILLVDQILDASQTLAEAGAENGTVVDVVLQPIHDRLAVKSKAKVVVLGDMSVGKSAMLAKFTNAEFKNEPTVGLDFISHVVPVNDEAVRLQMFDISGAQQYRALVPDYVTDADAILVVYDITNQASFLTGSKLLQLGKSKLVDSAPVWLVGNKSDLARHREVSEEAGRTLASQYGAAFLETSIATDINVLELLQQLAEELICMGLGTSFQLVHRKPAIMGSDPALVVSNAIESSTSTSKTRLESECTEIPEQTKTNFCRRIAELVSGQYFAKHGLNMLLN